MALRAAWRHPPKNAIRPVLGLSGGCESESEVSLMWKKKTPPASKLAGFPVSAIVVDKGAHIRLQLFPKSSISTFLILWRSHKPMGIRNHQCAMN